MKIKKLTFRETAQFSQESLRKATVHHTDSFNPLTKLIVLLKHLNILTTLTSTSEKVTYFIPCILRNVQACRLALSSNSSDPAFLMLCYKCGYVPLGIFSATITNLISQNLADWELCSSEMNKNIFRFRVGRGCDMVILISRPKYMEVAINRGQSSSLPLELLCHRVRSVIMSTLETVTAHTNYQLNLTYKFGFECPDHPGRDHLCTLASEEDTCMKCSQDPKNFKFFDLNWQQKVWFGGSETS